MSGPAPVPLIPLPSWLGDAPASAPVFRQMSSGVGRNDAPLTDEQKAEVTAYAERLGVPEGVMRFNDNMNTSYANVFGQPVMYVGMDAYPHEGGTRANSLVSMKGALAHEWVGHQAAEAAGKTHADPLLEEVQASMRAAMHGPDLSDAEREVLMQDAQQRLDTVGLTIDEVRGQLWLEP